MRCSQCVLPDNTPNIAFDQNGVCDYCHRHQKFHYKGEDEFIKTLDTFRRPDSKYDFVVIFNGGRDRSYVLLKLVKDYGMKVLAVKYENPFRVPQAKANIENAIKALGVDVVHFKDGRNLHKRTVRNLVAAWLKKPSPALIPMICSGCKPIWVPACRIARKHDIHCIVSGMNRFEVVSFKRELVGISRDESSRRAFFRYIYSLREIAKNSAYLSPSVVLILMKAFLFGNPYSIGLRLLWPDITCVPLFDYVEWNDQEVLSRIEAELGWESPPELASTWRYDCRIKHLRDYMYMKTLNMTEKEDFYAKMVREGLLTREDALRRIQNENKLCLDQVQLVLNQAGMEDTSLLLTEPGF